MTVDYRSGQVQALRDRAAQEQWPVSRLARVLHERLGVSLLRAWRLAHNCSLSATAEKLGESGLHVSGDTVGRWETGETTPGLREVDALCRLYRTNAQQLGLLGDYTPEGCVNSTPFPASSVTSCAPGLGASSVVPAWGGSLDHDRKEEGAVGGLTRRTILHSIAVMGGAVSAPIQQAASSLRDRLDALFDTSHISDRTVTHWERIADNYGRTYQTVPPLPLLCDALRDLAHLEVVLERRQPLDYQRRLLQVSARLSALVGVLMIDLGDYREARDWFHTASLAADETEDRTLRAWVAARAALVPLYAGDLHGAAQDAQDAARLAGRQPCSALALAAITQARALAQLGSSAEARKALETAHAAFDHISREQREDTLFGYTERQLHFHTGNVYAHLGALDEAEEAQRHAAALYSPEEYLDPALMGFDRALVLLKRSELDEACRQATLTLTRLHEPQRTSIVTSRARSVLHAIPPSERKRPAVRDYQEVLALTPAA